MYRFLYNLAILSTIIFSSCNLNKNIYNDKGGQTPIGSRAIGSGDNSVLIEDYLTGGTEERPSNL